MYFVDDNELNILEAAKNGIHVVRVCEKVLEASFAKRRSGSYGSPDEKAYYGHLSDLIRILEAR